MDTFRKFFKRFIFCGCLIHLLRNAGEEYQAIPGVDVDVPVGAAAADEACPSTPDINNTNTNEIPNRQIRSFDELSIDDDCIIYQRELQEQNSLTSSSISITLPSQTPFINESSSSSNQLQNYERIQTYRDINRLLARASRLPPRRNVINRENDTENDTENDCSSISTDLIDEAETVKEQRVQEYDEKLEDRTNSVSDQNDNENRIQFGSINFRQYENLNRTENQNILLDNDLPLIPLMGRRYNNYYSDKHASL